MVKKFIFLQFALFGFSGCAGQPERPQYPGAKLEQSVTAQYDGHRRRTDADDVLVQLLLLNR